MNILEDSCTIAQPLVFGRIEIGESEDLNAIPNLKEPEARIVGSHNVHVYPLLQQILCKAVNKCARTVLFEPWE